MRAGCKFEGISDALPLYENAYLTRKDDKLKFLESDRVYLRELNENDVDMLFELHNNKETMKYMPYNSISYEKAIYDVDDYASVSKLHPGFGMWATVLKDTDEVIGWTCLKKLPNSDDVEIGYRYLPQYWSKGYCTEICLSLIGYGFDTMNLSEIIAIVRPDNKASVRVIEKLNMRYIQMEKHYGMELKRYSILRNQYYDK